MNRSPLASYATALGRRRARPPGGSVASDAAPAGATVANSTETIRPRVPPRSHTWMRFGPVRTAPCARTFSPRADAADVSRVGNAQRRADAGVRSSRTTLRGIWERVQTGALKHGVASRDAAQRSRLRLRC